MRISSALAVILLGSIMVHAVQASTAEQCDTVIALSHPEGVSLEDTLYAVADPRSARYGNHLTSAELAALIGVDDKQEREIAEWALAHGGHLRRLSLTRDYAYLTLPCTLALSLRMADEAVDARIELPRSFSFAVSVHQDGRLLRPLARFQRATMKQWHEKQQIINRPVVRARLQQLADAPISGTIDNQKSSYGIPLSQRADSSHKQVVWGPGTFGFRADDLMAFYEEFNINTTVSSLHREGYAGVTSGDNFGEGTLDTTMISSMGLGAQTFVANTDNSSSSENSIGFGPALLNFSITLSDLSDDDLPYVWSISLGSLSWSSCNKLCEYVSNRSSSISYAQCLHYAQFTTFQVCMYPALEEEGRIQMEFMKLGVRGVSILSASGDGGSHYSFGPFPGDSPIGVALNEASCALNSPTFPAASPYVTVVGGTQWLQGGTPKNPLPWTDSGSGFAWAYPRPTYQDEAVEQYLAMTNQSASFPPPSGFNAAGRGYPDVSALSINVPMVINGQTVSAGGTSASTPEFAGIVALLNGVRASNQLPPLGFMNIRLYQVAVQHPGEAFYDMSTGNSNCGGNENCCSTGFPAAKGWDPTTGFGSPVWDGLVKYFTSD